MPRLTRRSTAALLWIAGIALYVAAVLIIGWRPIAESIAGARPIPVFAMAAITIAALWIRVLKWRLALGAQASAVALFWMSKAAGEWSPGRVGELSPLLLRRHRTPRVAAWILLDRVLEMTTTVALGVAGIALVRAPDRTAILAGAAIILAGLMIALAVLAQRRLFTYAASFFTPESKAARALAFGADAGAELKNFRRAIPIAIALTIVPGLMDVWAGILLYHAFDAQVTFALMAAVKGVHAITSAIPLTPNATGVPYLTAAVLLHEIGAVPSDVLAAAIALAVALSNAIFWLSALVAALLVRRTA